MARVQAFSSVSVVDLSDVGSINFYLTSNQPNSVIYDPNLNSGSYSPDWSQNGSNLRLTPVISYNGQTLVLNEAINAHDLIVEYTRKEGSGTATALQTGETVSGGILTVSANKMQNVSSGQLTYICKVTYTDPDTGVPIDAEASITFSLLSMAQELKYAEITGGSVFLYDTNRQLVGNNSMTLTANLKGVNVSQWQYQKSDKTWAAFPAGSGKNNSTNSGATLIVKHDESGIWLGNDKYAVIKLVTDDNDVTDIVQINKIRDGAPGNATVAAVLSNENHVVTANSDGSVKSWAGAETIVYIYEGGQDVTSQWTITVANGDGLTGTYNSSTHTYTPSALTVDGSYADFTCKRTGYDDVKKRYTITKQYSGADGKDAVVYEVVPDVYSLNLSEAGVWTPASGVTFTGYKKVGDADRTNYTSATFKIYESTDGTTFTQKDASSQNEGARTYRPSNNNVTMVKCIMFVGGTNQQLDEQTVVVTRDGVKGTDGTNGTDGLSMALLNYSDNIPCDSSGKAAAAYTINIPFYAFEGTTRVAVTAAVGDLPSGVSITSNTAGTTNAEGLIVLTVAKGATFGNASQLYGDISITLTAKAKSVGFKYSWGKNPKATNGTNAVLFELYSEDGGFVEIGKSTTIKTRMYSGATLVTPTSVAWYAFEDGEYKAITGQTGTTITITDTQVTDLMLLKCEAVYGGKTYTAFTGIDDTTDPVTAYTYATIKEFKNGKGCGAIFTRIYRNREEVDPIKTTVFAETAPTGASSGDYYYHLNSTNKTCVLKKYNGTQWVDATATADKDTYKYDYYRINNAGEGLDKTTAWKTGRCQYIDPSIINGRMIFICEVSENETETT